MPRAMARPWKHPKTGIFWLRKRVPDDLRPLVGKREEKRSLQTKDPAQARKLHAQALADVEAQWANLRKGSMTLGHREAHAIAGQFYESFVSHYAESPKSQTEWDPRLGDHLFREAPLPPPKPEQSIKDWLLETSDPNLFQ